MIKSTQQNKSTMLNNINIDIISKVFAHTEILEKHNILAKSTLL